MIDRKMETYMDTEKDRERGVGGRERQIEAWVGERGRESVRSEESTEVL